MGGRFPRLRPRTCSAMNDQNSAHTGQPDFSGVFEKGHIRP